MKKSIRGRKGHIKKALVLGVILLFFSSSIPAMAHGDERSAIVSGSETASWTAVSESWIVHRGTVKIHFYVDVDNDSMFDPGEPSPPYFIVHFRTQYSNLRAVANRFKIIGWRGDVVFRRIPYPAVYHLTAHFEGDFNGVMTEIWDYNGIVNLNEDMMGTRIYLPVQYSIIPM